MCTAMQAPPHLSAEAAIIVPRAGKDKRNVHVLLTARAYELIL